MILPKERDPRLITIRRGGSLSDTDHHLIALWAVACAEHVLAHFTSARPDDERPAQALDIAREWVRGERRMKEAHNAAFTANAAAREVDGSARFAALAAGQAVAVAHVAAHDLGAAAYAIRSAAAAAPSDLADEAAAEECRWQREQLPSEIRDLVLDDQRRRNDICWNVFTF